VLNYLQIPAARFPASVSLQYLPQNLAPALVQAGMHFSYEQPQLSAEAVDMLTKLEAMKVTNAIANEIRNMSTSSQKTDRSICKV
jgi:hypothetical protein